MEMFSAIELVIMFAIAVLFLYGMVDRICKCVEEKEKAKHSDFTALKKIIAGIDFNKIMEKLNEYKSLQTSRNSNSEDA